MTTDTSTTIPSNHGAPVATITTEQLFSNLYDTVHAQHGHLDEPEETLKKLLALIRLISVSTDDDVLALNIADIQWSLLLANDLIQETEKRMEWVRAYQRSEREELARLLGACHIIPTGLNQQRPCATEEVAK